MSAETWIAVYEDSRLKRLPWFLVGLLALVWTISNTVHMVVLESAPNVATLILAVWFWLTVLLLSGVMLFQFVFPPVLRLNQQGLVLKTLFATKRFSWTDIVSADAVTTGKGAWRWVHLSLTDGVAAAGGARNFVLAGSWSGGAKAVIDRINGLACGAYPQYASTEPYKRPKPSPVLRAVLYGAALTQVCLIVVVPIVKGMQNSKADKLALPYLARAEFIATPGCPLTVRAGDDFPSRCVDPRYHIWGTVSRDRYNLPQMHKLDGPWQRVGSAAVELGACGESGCDVQRVLPNTFPAK